MRPFRTPLQSMEPEQHTDNRRKRHTARPPGVRTHVSPPTISWEQATGEEAPLPRFDLAILHDPDNPEPPSNEKAMQKFKKAAEELSMRVEFITRSDIGRLPEFDALFIRDTTFVNHYTYRFSRRAFAEGWWLSMSRIPSSSAITKSIWPNSRAAQYTHPQNAAGASGKYLPNRSGPGSSLHPEAAGQLVLARSGKGRNRN